LTQPRCTSVEIEFDIVGRLTPCSSASSVRVRGWFPSIVSSPKCAGAGISPAARNSAATVRMTSGMILRISRAASRERERVMAAGNLGGLTIKTAKVPRAFRRVDELWSDAER